MYPACNFVAFIAFIFLWFLFVLHFWVMNNELACAHKLAGSQFNISHEIQKPKQKLWRELETWTYVAQKKRFEL